MNATSTGDGPARPQFSGPVLASNLVAGALWLLVLVVLRSPGLALIGAGYVVVASLFFAVFYARESYTRRQEALAWFVPWLAAVALWALVFLQIGGAPAGISEAALGSWVAVVVATPCYLVWQLLGLAFRQFIAYRARTA